MPTTASSSLTRAEADARLRIALEGADAAREAAAAQLRQALAGDPVGRVNERVIAQVAAQIDDLARQRPDEEAPGLADRPALIAHLHARAVEFAITEHLSEALAVDAVFPPVLRAAWAAQPSAELQALLAAQARFVQDQRRGEIAAAELPGAVRREIGWEEDAAGPDRAELLAHFIASAPQAKGLLDPAQAGASLFASALSARSGLARDQVILAIAEPGQARLALALLAAGLAANNVERRLFGLDPAGHPANPVPELDQASAAALLNGEAG